jgi:hypothetical protein
MRRCLKFFELCENVTVLCSEVGQLISHSVSPLPQPYVSEYKY